MAECQHPRADRIYRTDGRRQCGRCASTLEPEPATETPCAWDAHIPLGWPAPRWGINLAEYQMLNKFRSDTMRAAYRRSILPVNVVLVEAWADD